MPTGTFKALDQTKRPHEFALIEALRSAGIIATPCPKRLLAWFELDNFSQSAMEQAMVNANWVKQTGIDYPDKSEGGVHLFYIEANIEEDCFAVIAYDPVSGEADIDFSGY